MHGDRVGLRINTSLHHDRFAQVSETAGQNASPQFEVPRIHMHLRSRQALTFLVDETNPAEVQRLWIVIFPIGDRFRITRRQRQCHPSVIWRSPRPDLIFRDTRWKWKTVPAPMAHDVAADCFKARAVNIEGKIAVTQRDFAIDTGPFNIVPGHQGVSVNRQRRFGKGGQPASSKPGQR